ncbi:hypothetical protein FRC11_000815 [Ceratobasidium sp. 423]|nr:hypothetical protein FRC11_000815 [Ceratobasidium sp. 423]
MSGATPSAAGGAAGPAVHHNRTSSVVTDYSTYDPQASMHTQGRHHTHNHPPPEQLPGSSRLASCDCSSPGVNSIPQPRQVHALPPTHQGVRANSQVHTSSNPSPRNSYLPPGNYAHSSGSPLPGSSANRNSFYQFDQTQVPPSPGWYNGNMPDEHYHSAQHDLRSIPEDVPQAEFGNQWDHINDPIAANLPPGYGVPPLPPNHTQPSFSSNPHAHATFDYPHPQHFGTSFQQPHVSSGLPADPYRHPEPPNRQWTQEVWGNQEFGLPIRTDSPTSMDYPLTGDVYSMVSSV